MESDLSAPNPTPATSDALEVEINDGQRFLAVDPLVLTALVQRTLRAEGVISASISVALVDDRTIHEVNRRHLDHDWPTDVISFRFSEPDDSELSGELVVSAEMAATTAAADGLDPFAELALYVVHGLLHLCGRDDQTEADTRVMRQREAEILAAEGLDNTFPRVGSRPDAGREGVRWDG